MKKLIALAATLMLIGTACSSGSETVEATECEVGQTDGDLSLYNWTEYIEPELITDFETEFGVSITETFFDSNEAMLAQVEAGGATYDLVVPSDYMVGIMAEAELLIPLNKDAIPNLSNLDPQFTNLPFDPAGDYSVPYQWGTTGIGYSYDAVPEDWEASWEILFDPAFAMDSGSASLLNDPRETMGAALKFLGYSVNTTSDVELDEAVALVEATLDRIAKFDSDQFEDDLMTGQVVAAHGYSGDFFAAFDEASTDDYDAYEDFGYGIPKEGAVAWVDNIAIPTVAEHPCTAHTFINFILDAENGAALTNYNYYASPNAASDEFIDPEIFEDETIYPSDDVMDRLEFIEDTGDFEINFTDAFVRAKG